MERKRHRRVLAVHPSPKEICAPNTTNEIDSFARAWVLDSKQGGKDFVLEEADIELRHRIGICWHFKL